MSPLIVQEEDTMHCFPRVSGDEPMGAKAATA